MKIQAISYDLFKFIIIKNLFQHSLSGNVWGDPFASGLINELVFFLHQGAQHFDPESQETSPEIGLSLVNPELPLGSDEETETVMENITIETSLYVY